MRRSFSLSAVLVIILLAVAGVSTLSTAQEATTTATTTATCCTVRVDEFQLNPGGDTARVVINWTRSDGSIQERRAFAITDGDAADNTDNYLWGTGVAPQPAGIMRKIGTNATDETGTLRLRFNKAILRWMQTNGRIGATEITIP